MRMNRGTGLVLAGIVAPAFAVMAACAPIDAPQGPDSAPSENRGSESESNRIASEDRLSQGLNTTGRTGSAQVTLAAATPATTAQAAQAAQGGVGSACEASPEDPTGGCDQGLFCLPVPGGYCTTLCDGGVSCGPDAVCVDSHRGGEGCAASCASDADCRADEGYACDPVWGACILPGVMPVAPKAPVCEPTERLAKRRFGPAVQVSSGADGITADVEVQATLDADGDVTAAYIARTFLSAPNPLGISTIKTDGTIEADRRLPDDQEFHFDPWMASDRKGRMYLSWLGFNGDEEDMRVGLSISRDGHTWTPAIAAHDPADCPGNAPHCLDKPVIAIGPDAKRRKRDAIYIVYAAGERGQRMVKSTDGGKTFGGSVAVSDYSYGDLRVDAKGGVHAVNSTVSPQSPDTFGDPNGSIEYLYSKHGEEFAAPVVVSRPGEGIPGLFVNPQVVPDRKRRTIYVLYPSGRPDTQWDLQLAVSTDWGRSWSHHQVNDDAPCANHMLPAAALDPVTGQVHVMWVENRGGVGQVAYAACDRTGCEPNQRVSDEPFAAYSFVRHSSKWLGEYNKLLFDPKRRVLHAVWAQPVDEGGVPRSRIFHAQAALP